MLVPAVSITYVLVDTCTENGHIKYIIRNHKIPSSSVLIIPETRVSKIRGT